MKFSLRLKKKAIFSRGKKQKKVSITTTATNSVYSHLDRLVGQRFVRVRYVLHGNTVELAFVDVRHPVVFAPLVGGDRRFQIITEPVVGESIEKKKKMI